jgi:hypothetical protein
MTIEAILERIAFALEDIAKTGEVASPLSERTTILPKPASEKKVTRAQKAEVKPAPEAEDPLVEGEKSAPTYDQVRAAIMDVSAQKGRGEAVAILGKFGVTSGKELKPGDYQKVLDAIATALDN